MNYKILKFSYTIVKTNEAISEDIFETLKEAKAQAIIKVQEEKQMLNQIISDIRLLTDSDIETEI